MEMVREVCTDGYDQVVQQFTGQQLNELKTYLLTFSMGTSYYLTFTPQGMEATVGNIFTSEVKREFVMRFTNCFLARFGDCHAKYTSLVETLVWSFDMVGSETQQYLAIPDEIQKRLPTGADIRKLLMSNKWLVAMSTLWLYHRVSLSATGKALVK